MFKYAEDCRRQVGGLLQHPVSALQLRLQTTRMHRRRIQKESRLNGKLPLPKQN